MKTTLAILAFLSLFQINSFEVSAQTNKPVLFEMFTNAHCGPCGSAYGIINSQLKTSQYADDIIYVFYHVATYSDDKLYQDSKTESMPRAGLYGVTSTPTVYIDGVRTGSSNWLSSIGARTQKSHDIELNATAIGIGQNMEITINAISKSLEYSNVKLLVGYVKNVNYLGRNGVSQHNNVMVTMPSTFNGQTVSISKDFTTKIELSSPLSFFDNDSSFYRRFIVFVQDSVTKEVYASKQFDLEYLVLTNVKNENDKPTIPITITQSENSKTTFTFDSPISANASLQIFDILGNLVFTTNFTSQQQKQSIVWNYTFSNGNTASNGVYLYKMNIGMFETTGKFLK
jgi:hypothetical protein